MLISTFSLRPSNHISIRSVLQSRKAMLKRYLLWRHVDIFLLIQIYTSKPAYVLKGDLRSYVISTKFSCAA